MRGFGIFIIGIASVLPMVAHAASASSSLMVTATAVANCSIQIDQHAFKHHKEHNKMKFQYLHTECAGGALAYQVYGYDRHSRYAEYDKDDRRSRKDDSHFEKISEHHDNDGIRWITAEF